MCRVPKHETWRPTKSIGQGAPGRKVFQKGTIVGKDDEEILK